MMKYITVLALGAFLLSACTSKEKQAPADSADSTVVAQDSIIQPDAESAQQVEACKAFLEQFYQGLESSQYDYAYIRKNVTPKAEQILKDQYDYECNDGDCLAVWLFTHGITDPGEIKDLTVEPLGGTLYKVLLTYDRGLGEIYNYAVKLSLAQEGDAFKIDTIEPESN